MARKSKRYKIMTQKTTQKVSILHLITSAKNASPFDVNMAYDAGFDKIMPYTNVLQDDIVALTQDAMFSRSPSGVKREALFFGGRDIHVALAMQKTAVLSMFMPFEMSTIADPSGAFTTAAALIAKIDAHLKLSRQTLAQQTIAIFGASGTVGTTSALIAASLGATVHMVAHKNVAQMQAYADTLHEKYGFKMQVVDGTNDAAKTQILNNATVTICAAIAGLRVIEMAHFAQSKTLKIIADVNAVAPSGAAGVEVMSDGELIADTQIAGFGALMIGQLKYKTQQKLLQNMLNSETPIHLDFNDAFEVARDLIQA
jgi:methylene-tetrahydromethanopterin dehydrogenase